MTAQNWIELAESSADFPQASGSTALATDPETSEILSFRISPGVEALQALLHARRSMLREERTLGRGEGEPSLEDAVFSAEGIVWRVQPGQRAACVRTIAELEARIKRTLADAARR